MLASFKGVDIDVLSQFYIFEGIEYTEVPILGGLHYDWSYYEFLLENDPDFFVRNRTKFIVSKEEVFTPMFSGFIDRKDYYTVQPIVRFGTVIPIHDKLFISQKGIFFDFGPFLFYFEGYRCFHSCSGKTILIIDIGKKHVIDIYSKDYFEDNFTYVYNFDVIFSDSKIFKVDLKIVDGFLKLLPSIRVST